MVREAILGSLGVAIWKLLDVVREINVCAFWTYSLVLHLRL